MVGSSTEKQLLEFAACSSSLQFAVIVDGYRKPITTLREGGIELIHSSDLRFVICVSYVDLLIQK